MANPKYLKKQCVNSFVNSVSRQENRKDLITAGNSVLRLPWSMKKITNQRNDFLQKQSTMLIRENQTICIEDLKVKNMMRNHKLAQHIGSAAWGKFFDMLTYKSASVWE